MVRSCFFVVSIFISLFFSGCSSSETLSFTLPTSDFKTSKKFCTNTSNLANYTSKQLHLILLHQAKNDILFEFLDNNSSTNSSYDDLEIIKMIKIKYEKFEMSDDFTDYCLEVDAEIVNTQKIQNEMVLEDFCSNFCQEHL